MNLAKKKNNSKHQKKIKEGRTAYGYQIMNELSNATRKKNLVFTGLQLSLFK